MTPLHVEVLIPEVPAKSAAPPLVLLHGFTGDSTTWSRLVPELPRERRVVAVDLIGHGRSPRPRGIESYTMSAAVAQLAKTLLGAGLAPAHTLGYSMGGRVALQLALTRPQLVRSQVLIGATAGMLDDEERRNRFAEDDRLADFIEAAGIEEFVDRWMAQPLFASQNRLGTRHLAAARRQRLGNSPHALAASLRGMGAGAMEPLWDRLAEIRAPTLVVAGGLDGKFCALGQGLCDGLPNATLAVVAAAGHAVHVEAPRELAQLIAGFLERHDPG